MERKPKTVYQLDTPFTSVGWPKISDQNEKLIFELLCSTLAPIGQHRNAHVTPSRGKRSQKRKRQEAKEKALSNSSIENEEGSSVPPPPEIQKHVTVGLNSILRHLQSQSQASKPTTASPQEPDIQDLPPSPNFAAIFALPPSPNTPTLLTTHLPTLIHTSSLTHPSLPSTRLIPLSLTQSHHLTTILSLPRISHLGILDSAPGAEALIAVIREKVPEIETPWLSEGRKMEYLGTKINSIETFVGVSRKEIRGCGN